MIKYIPYDRYDTEGLFGSGADFLVNTVNCLGGTGKGLNKAFSFRYPDNEVYLKKVADKRGQPRRGLISIGKMYVTYVRGRIDGKFQHIINFPTKYDWKEPSKLEYIEQGLFGLVDYLQIDRKPRTIAIPALGCGLGGLAWKDVKQLIDYILKDETIQHHTFLVYEPKLDNQ